MLKLKCFVCLVERQIADSVKREETLLAYDNFINNEDKALQKDEDIKVDNNVELESKSASNEIEGILIEYLIVFNFFFLEITHFIIYILLCRYFR